MHRGEEVQAERSGGKEHFCKWSHEEDSGHFGKYVGTQATCSCTKKNFMFHAYGHVKQTGMKLISNFSLPVHIAVLPH